jgi:hypothetical protein
MNPKRKEISKARKEYSSTALVVETSRDIKKELQISEPTSAGLFGKSQGDSLLMK